MFWGWLCKQLHKMVLADLRAKRAVLEKPAYVARIKSLIRSTRAQTKAKAFAKKFRSSCVQVVQRKGAAADN